MVSLAATDRDRAADARIARLPAFSLPATCGTLTAAQLAGAGLALYFYPKDATPGCTTQASDFRDMAAKFEAAGVRIIGVSRDGLASHQRFRERERLSFDLISDPDETLCALFDVVREKNMYGRVVRGIQRSTFLFDHGGKLRHSWRGLKVPGHVATVLAAARSMMQSTPPSPPRSPMEKSTS